MTTTPRVGATDWAAAQASPWIAHNAALRRIEAGAGRYAITDRVTAPPGTCADGASYIIIATATGAFASKEGQIATAVGTNAANGWLYTVLGTLHEGTVSYVQDEDVEYKWSGSAWATYGGAGYSPGGTDVALADGGTGASLTDPNADRIMFWDDSAGAVDWLTAGTGLSISGTTISATATGTGDVVGPSSSVDNHVAVFDSTTGKLLKDGGVALLANGANITPAATPATNAVGYLGAPQNAQPNDYTFVMSDAGKHIYHSNATPHTYTIPANGSVAYPIGTIIAIVNANGSGALTLAITTDTLRWGSSTGSRTIAADGTASLLKVTSTVWRLTGDGIT